MRPSRSEDKAKMAPRLEWNRMCKSAGVPKHIVKLTFLAIRRGCELRRSWSQDGDTLGHMWAQMGASMRLV